MVRMGKTTRRPQPHVGKLSLLGLKNKKKILKNEPAVMYIFKKGSAGIG